MFLDFRALLQLLVSPWLQLSVLACNRWHFSHKMIMLVVARMKPVWHA
jgi:hypothetical protein